MCWLKYTISANLDVRTCMTPSLFRFSRISSSVEGPKSWHRMTPLEVLREPCKEIFTLDQTEKRNNIHQSSPPR